MCKNWIDKKRFWVFVIAGFVIIAYLLIMTPLVTHSDIYEPNDIDLNGNTFVKLICKSNTQFITSFSDIKCSVGIRSETWNYTYTNMIIQAVYENNTKPFWGCFSQMWNISGDNEPVMIPCKNEYYNDTIARPAKQIYMKLIDFEARFANPQVQNPEPLTNEGKEIFFDRPVEVMSRNEQLNIEISRNNLFIATLALIVIAILETRKFIKLNKNQPILDTAPKQPINR